MFEWDAEADQIGVWEEKLLSNQREINRLYAEQGKLVGKLDPHQIAWSSGDRNVTDWLSATLDISHQTARRLRTLAYSPDSPIKAELAQGEIGLDRAALLTELAQTGLTASELLSLSPHYSLGRLYGMLESRRRQDRRNLNLASPTAIWSSSPPWTNPPTRSGGWRWVPTGR